MQWIPGPEPQGDSTDEILATPALSAANAAPFTPGTSLGSTPGREVSGPVAWMSPVALLSRTSTTAPGRTHSVSPLSALVTVTPVREQSCGVGVAAGDGATEGAGDSVLAGSGEAAGDGEAVVDAGDWDRCGAAGLVATVE